MRSLVMANRVGRPHTGAIEAEPVVVDTDDPNIVVLELDDGERLELDPDELRAALEEAA